jgi:hypothetical protein
MTLPYLISPNILPARTRPIPRALSISIIYSTWGLFKSERGEYEKRKTSYKKRKTKYKMINVKRKSKGRWVRGIGGFDDSVL